MILRNVTILGTPPQRQYVMTSFQMRFVLIHLIIRLQHAAILDVEQALLALQTGGIASETAVGADDPVAGDDDDHTSVKRNAI